MHTKHKLARFAPLLLFATLTVLLTACPGVSGGNNGNNSGAPQITSFTATPNVISAAGQPVTLNWVITGVPTSLSISGSDGTNLSSLSGTNYVVNPTTTTTYTLTATNSSGTDDEMITVNVGGTVTPPTDGSRTVSFGVSLLQTGPFQSDADGNISAGDSRIVNVAAGNTFYASVSYSGPSSVTGVTIYLANSSPANFKSDLVTGTDVNGFTLGEAVGGCATDGTQTSVTCIYPITVASGTPNITGLDGAGSEFAYVLRTRVTDTTGTIYDQPPRGYVTVGGSSTPPTNPNPPTEPPTNPPTPPTDPNPPVTPPGPTAPKINSFTADPKSIESGDSSTLSWSISGTVTKLSIDNNVGTVTGSTSKSVSPTTTTTYTLTASNGSASATKTVTVTVSNGGGGGGGQTAPTITSFSATPSSISAGGSSTLAWTTTGTVTSLSINNGVGSVTGTTSKSVSPTATTTYTLTAKNGSASTTKTVTVTVGGGTETPEFTVSVAEVGNITLNDGDATASLDGTVSGSPPGVTTYKWTAEGDEGDVTPIGFNPDNSVDTVATFSFPGTYILRLTATNGTETASDAIEVSVYEPMYTLTISQTGNGDVVSPEGGDCGQNCTTYDVDSYVTLTAEPEEGSSFAGWGGECAFADTSTTCEILMDDNKEVVANFEANTP